MKKVAICLMGLLVFNLFLLKAAVITEKNAFTKSAVTNDDALVDELVVMDAMHEFKSLTRVEKKMRLKEVKKEIANYKEEKAAGTEADTSTLLLAILAILLPPLAVYLHEGSINGKFWLSLLLTLLGWLPGIIYALIVVL